MITDADIKKMKAVFATKEDLEGIDAKMATKDDLKRFATKEDLKAFATKENLKLFATKDDLKDLSKKIDVLSNSLQKNTEELIELITLGFESNEKRFKRIEAEAFKSN